MIRAIDIYEPKIKEFCYNQLNNPDGFQDDMINVIYPDEGSVIVSPYHDFCGMYEVDPIEYYGTDLVLEFVLKFKGYLIHEITIDMGSWVKVAVKLDYETTSKLIAKYWSEAYESEIDIADYFMQFDYELILLEEN